MRNLSRVVLMCALPFFTLVRVCSAQDSLVLTSGAAAPNGAVALYLDLASPAGSEPAAIQWTLSYPPANVVDVQAVAGPSAASAGKALNCSTGVGVYRCVMYGPNTNRLSNGSVATVYLMINAGVAKTGILVTNTIGALPSGFVVPVSAAGGVVSGGAQPSVSSLACSPGSVSSLGTAACTVRLTAPAPSGGATVSVTSNNAQLGVPASVTVAAAATAANFNATAATITSNQTAILTASYNGGSATANVGLTAPARVSSLTCNPGSLGANASATCTVNLTQAAPAGGAVVTLTDTSTALTTPASVTLAAGATSGSFSVSTGAVAASQTAVVTASYNGATANATIALQASTVTLSGLVCGPTTLGSNMSGTCTVRLTGAAPTGGALVTVTNTSGILSAPGSVTIAAGAAAFTFTIAAGAVTSNQTATLTATYNGSSQRTTVNLALPAQVSSLGCNPASLGANASATCTVNLTQAAPAGGAVVRLTDTSTALTTPASVTVAAGATSGSFSVSTGAVAASQTAVVTAGYNGATASTPLNLVATVTVSGLSCSPASLGPSSAATCTVRLAQAATGTGAPVTITDSSAALTAPAAITVAAGASSGTFSVTTGTFAANQSVSVTAAANGSSANATVSLVAVAPHSLTCTPQTIAAGATASCHVTLSQTSATSSSVLLTSSSANVVILTGVVTIPSGGLSADFKIFVNSALTADQAATVTAALNGVSALAALSLTAAGADTESRTNVERVSCAPKTMVAGARGVCRLELSQPGRAVDIALTSSSSSVRLPATVTAREGQRALEFRVDALGTEDNITVTASLNGRAAQATISVARERGRRVRTPGAQFVRYGDELRFTVRAEETGARLRSGPLPDGASFDADTGELRWTPSAAQIGIHEIEFATRSGEAGAGSAAVKVQVESGEPVVERIVNAASRSDERVCSPGAMAAIEGRWLSSGEAEDATGASKQLAGTKVWVSGELVPVLSAYSSRVTVVCPNAAPGVDLEFTVETDHGTGGPRHTQSLSAAAGLFSLDGSGAGQGLAVLQASGRVAMMRNGEVASQPAAAGDLLAIYATGIDHLTNVNVGSSDIVISPNAISQVAGRSGLFQILLSLPEIKKLSQISLYLTGQTPEGVSLTSNEITVAYEADIQSAYFK